MGISKPGLKAGFYQLKSLNRKPSKNTIVSKKLTVFANSARNNL